MTEIYFLIFLGVCFVCLFNSRVFLVQLTWIYLLSDKSNTTLKMIIILVREALKKKIEDLRTRSQSWGEGSNQTLIKKISAIKTEKLREGGSSVNYQF